MVVVTGSLALAGLAKLGSMALGKMALAGAAAKTGAVAFGATNAVGAAGVGLMGVDMAMRMRDKGGNQAQDVAAFLQACETNPDSHPSCPTAQNPLAGETGVTNAIQDNSNAIAIALILGSIFLFVIVILIVKKMSQ